MTFQIWSWVMLFIALAVAAVLAWRVHGTSSRLAIGVLLWLTIAIAASFVGFFPDPTSWDRPDDLIGFALFGTLMALPVVLWFTVVRQRQDVQRAVNQLPLSFLVGLQVYRIGGLIFAWMFFSGMMPAAMSGSTATLDILVGITALVLAVAIGKREQRKQHLSTRLRIAVIVWSVVGVMDFVIAILVFSADAVGLLELSPPPLMLGEHPLALVSLFQVPLAVIIHLLAIERVRHTS